MTQLLSAVPVLGSAHHVIELPTGVLSIRVDHSDIVLENLCGFAARRNPKRGFLFVSRVLGKHIPVRPSVMRDVHTRLAAKISADLPGPVVFVGMAETAIGLGHGVYEEYLRLTGRQDTVFVHSTRYRLNRPTALEFLEEHSHAADHIIYTPEDEELARRFDNARSIVLVDDEASTGKTLINLTRAFNGRLSNLQRASTVVITDWRGPAKRSACHEAMPVAADSVALLTGEYHFQAAPGLVAVQMPKVTGNGACKDHLLHRNYGRLGVGAALVSASESACTSSRCPGAILTSLRGSSFCSSAAHSGLVQAIASSGFLGRRGAKHLILGTGEFAYPPFLLAEQMEKLGFDVHYQSTTRSPIMEGGAIAHSLQFTDNYEDGIPNFLYNASAQMYDRIIVCHETPHADLDPHLVETLRAQSLAL